MARPLPDVPEADEALAVAFPDAAEPELDVVLELAPELQAARANPAAMAAAKAAGRRDVKAEKLDRFIFIASAREFVVVVIARGGWRVLRGEKVPPGEGRGCWGGEWRLLERRVEMLRSWLVLAPGLGWPGGRRA